MHIKSNKDAPNAMFSLPAMCIVQRGPLADDYRAPKDTEVADAWFCSEEELLGGRGDVSICIEKTPHR